ncbi:MAG: hypothetical protein DRO92_03835 [Candidatus Altiarchaeales archaeon]|nr:MAG: hypothetical protein DRO92_03835 [Candidatus Altiarchaeales archaeon]
MRLDLSDIKELGYKGIAIFIFIALILAFIYNLLTHFDLIMSFVAMIIAVFGSYLIFVSFEKEVIPPKLDDDENIILESIDKGYVLFPRKKGRFFGKRSHKYLSLYLTNKRIIGKDTDVILDINLKSIKNIKVERKLFREYIRLRYLENNEEKDVLLVTGDTKLWMKKLNELGVK